jgi:tetratricopeptide (TPR) repeat protein
LLAAGLGAVQFASDGIFSGAAAARSFPAALSVSSGTGIYQAIARVAPAPYVNGMLARAAFARGDLQTAQSYARALPASGNRSELLARIALAYGDHRSAQRFFVSAGDAADVDAEVDRLAQRDLRVAYALELELKNRLEQSGTHPDATAQTYWRLGVLAAREGRRDLAMMQYRRALDLSPISGKYLISAGFQAYELRSWAEAKQDFQRAINVDPQSADAYAGAGMTALAMGDRTAAQTFAARSKALDANSHALKTLESQLH